MLIKKAHELRVYQLAFQLALDIHKASLNFPKIEQYALADQMRRASKSICANIAEGFAKQTHSKPEFRRFITMAIGSAVEMQTWIAFALELAYTDRHVGEQWHNQYDFVLRMLEKLKSSNSKSSNSAHQDSDHQLIKKRNI